MRIERYRFLLTDQSVSPISSEELTGLVPAPQVPMALRLIGRSSSSSISTTEDFVIEALAQYYSFPAYGEVRNFLKVEPQVASLLFTVREAIDVHFGNGTLATLRLSRGFGSTLKNCREILVVIRSYRNAEETMAQLDSLSSAWWNKNVPTEVRLKMLFMVEYA
ncbi:MAG: hypothetical protein JWN14_3806 [Chthonomonadales bacterium]|nr:hypothetical protein [Chthonomonadales bacterium]